MLSGKSIKHDIRQEKVSLLTDNSKLSKQQNSLIGIMGKSPWPVKTRGGSLGSVPIQRAYKDLNSMSKARVDQQSDEAYYQKSLAFEQGMVPVIMKDGNIVTGVDGLLRTLAEIVDAWAIHTGKSKEEAYEREFGWNGGDGYYGAFEMTAANITSVLTKSAEPVRKRLKLLYNAVRNNNLSKWLKLAAIELDRKAKGKTARNWRIRTHAQKVEHGIVKSDVLDEELTPGFAEDSGLGEKLVGPQLDELVKIANRERVIHKPFFRATRDEFSPTAHSAVLAWKPQTMKANGERRFLASSGIVVEDRETLRGSEVSDPAISDSEIDQIAIRKNEPVSPAFRARFRADANSKTNWSQGRDYYDIDLGSESALIAHKVKARMDAGISGSTDLMLHAFQWLGVAGDEMKTLRLALAGWMMANRDHSFYEVLKAAEAYGLAFNPNPGDLYEDDANLYPLTKDLFNNVLPSEKGASPIFPKYYLSQVFKESLSASLLDTGKTKEEIHVELRDDDIPSWMTEVMSEQDTAELLRLRELVRALVINAGDTKSQKLKKIRDIRKSSPYVYLGNVFGVLRVDSMLDTFVRKFHPASSMENDDPWIRFAEAGIPITLLKYRTKDDFRLIEELRVAVQNARVVSDEQGEKNIEGEENINRARIALIRKGIKEKEVNIIQNGLIKKYHDDVVLSEEKQSDAQKMTRMSQLEMIASMERTSGVWYSWGNKDMLDRYVKAPSLREATSSVPSAQGSGLYISSTLSRSCSYGEKPGQRVLVVTLNNVPTININNPAQKEKLRRLVPPEGSLDVLESAGVYGNVIEILMLYGSGNFGRLTTNEGVTLIQDVSIIPESELRKEVPKLTDGAKLNFMSQARDYRLDITPWERAKSVSPLILDAHGIPISPPPLPV